MTFARAWPWAAAVAAALSAAAGALPAPLAAFALALAWGWAPGAVLAPLLLPRGSRALRALAALALSPFLTGAPFSALVAAGVPLHAAAVAVSALVAVAALAVALGARGRAAPARRAAGDGAAFAVAAAWTALAAVLLVGNTLLPLRSDGWFHAAVTAQIAARGVPPEDPYFAGLRLLYFWGSHAWASAWLVLAPRLEPWTPLMALNLSGAFAVVLGVGAIAQRLRANAAGVTLACLVALLGYSPFAWGMIVGRAFTGNVLGWADVVHQAGHGIDPVLATMATGQLHGSLAFFGDKYLVLTPFGMGLALLALVVCAALELLESPSARAATALGLALAATLFVHTVVGYAALLLCATWFAIAVARALAGSRDGAAALVPLALAVIAAVLLLSPYLAEITLGKRGQLSVGMGRKALYSFVVGGAFYVPAGFAWLAARARRDAAALALLVPGLLVAGLALALRLPENNQSKFLNLLFLLLAAPAALGIQSALARIPERARVAAAGFLLLAALPNLALACWGFAGEIGIGVHAWRATSAQREACEWARAHTPRDAALCDPIVARDLLVHGARSVFWGGPYGERDWGYDPADLAARRALVSELALGRDPAGAAAALLAAQQREVVLVARAGAPDSIVSRAAIEARPDRFEPLWSNEAMAFYRVRRTP
ncbi:MAG: hypothetical protein IT348_16090 [Candidatus Eisenbacteria bacterium]|nr:hypothetical protein [Candidatus Eisenbacteria bacterium]